MATEYPVPIVLPESADDYITNFGTAATAYLEHGTAASSTAAGTVSSVLVSGTERYEFWVPTTSQYLRWRVGGGGDFTDYSAYFQAPVAYATLQELRRGMDLPDDSRDDELQALLMQASDYITHEVCGGRRFFRDPVYTGTTTITLDVVRDGQPSLWQATGQRLDIISLTSVGIATVTGGAYSAILTGSTGWYLSPGYPKAGWPYEDVVLSNVGTTATSWPSGYSTVQLVGAFGWPAIPDLVKRATVDLAREWYRQGPGGGGPVGINAFGTPVFGGGEPASIRQLRRSEYAWRAWAA